MLSRPDWPSHGLLWAAHVDSVAEAGGGCSEAYARVVGRRSRRPGLLSSVEAQTWSIEGADRQPSVPKLGRPWAVRGRSTVAIDDQRRPPGTRAHGP
jgi:hypothetical protein